MDPLQQNGDITDVKPVQLSIPLPHAPDTRIRLQLSILEKSILLFLTTTSAESTGSAAPLGSFVYALPNVRNGLSKKIALEANLGF